MSPDGEVLDTWYGRSVICSATKLAYEHAQDMLDNPEKDWSEVNVSRISPKLLRT